MKAKRMNLSGGGLLMMTFGSAAGYSFASLLSSSLLETDKSFRKNIEKIVPNKVNNPRRIQIERKTDPNDFYLDKKEQAQKMKAIVDGLQSEKNFTKTQHQLQMYHLRKNFVYGLVAGSMGLLINRRLLSYFSKRSLPLYLSIPVNAPLGILTYYCFSGAFDNMSATAVIDKYVMEAPVLIGVKFAVDAIRIFVKQKSRDANLINMNLLQKAKTDKVDLKTVRLVRLHPIYSIASVVLIGLWFIFLISAFEERLEVDVISIGKKLSKESPTQEENNK
jgi:hypothetical protein